MGTLGKSGTQSTRLLPSARLLKSLAQSRRNEHNQEITCDSQRLSNLQTYPTVCFCREVGKVLQMYVKVLQI